MKKDVKEGGQETDSEKEKDKERTGDEESEDKEEGRNARILRAPPIVSQRERDEHNATHCPFRSWCQYCVKGRSHKMPHVKVKDDEETKVPRISMDYFYASAKDERAK